MKAVSRRERGREIRKARGRKRFAANTSRPRLAVFRSNRHIYAQIIDDATNRTLIAASTLSKELENQLKKPSTIEAASKVGALIARKAKEQHISTVAFDRGGDLYHGRVKALADAARAEGLKF